MEEQLISEFIIIQKKPIKYLLVTSISIILIGLVIVVVGLFLKNDNLIKLCMSIGGGFVATLSGLPIKEILGRNERIQTVQSLTKMLHTVVNSTNFPASSLQGQIDKINGELWKFITKPLNN